jgi:hypothetical protein
MSETTPQDPQAFAASLMDPALAGKVSELLVGAVDLHVHSGPAAMPRILNHYDEMVDAEEAGFTAVVYKDHFYPGMAHAKLLQDVFPEKKVRLYSGIALNNAVGGVNPHAVDHAVKFGAKIVWMPTLSAANHVTKMQSEAKNFPKTAKRMLDPIPLSVLGDNGKLTDAAKQVLDIIAEGDVILAGGHLSFNELVPLFEDAKARGVKKMLVNHPTYLIGCGDDEIRQLVSMGVYMEHSIVMFIEGMARERKYQPDRITHLIEVAGVDNTLFCSDLGLQGSPRPVDGYRLFVQELLRLQVSDADIRKLTSENGKKLLDL